MLPVLFFAAAICGSLGQQYKLSVVSLPETSPGGDGARIIGGTPATIESFPYTVQILFSGQLGCGGSLLTQRHVLSAAHCFIDERLSVISPTLLSVMVGTATLASGGTTHGVSTIVVHEGYNTPARDNDVAVLVLSREVTLSARVGLASIPVQGFVVADNSSVIVLGWGRTNASVLQASPVLQQVGVYIVNRALCASRYGQLELLWQQPYPVTDNMICSGVLDVGGRDACQGDSGGPVVYSGAVVGVTSWGEGCAHPVYPGVNARVASYTNWINATVTRYNAAPSLGQTSILMLMTSVVITAVLRQS